MDHPSPPIPTEQYVITKAFNIYIFSYHLYPCSLQLSLRSFDLSYVGKLYLPNCYIHTYASLMTKPLFSFIFYFMETIPILARIFSFLKLISPSVTTNPTKQKYLCHTYLLCLMSFYSPIFYAM